jgi:hypothetical protein
MTSAKSTSFNPGDVIEVETPGGLAYLQITHDASPYPQVVRVLDGLHAHRPDDVAGLAPSPTVFVGLIPLAEILQRGLITGRLVTHATVPPEAQAFPVFRTPIRDRSGAVVYWWLWDGAGLHWCDPSDPAITDRPVREVIGAQDLLARLSALAAHG